jgi:molybdate transport system substrate-binding protein
MKKMIRGMIKVAIFAGLMFSLLWTPVAFAESLRVAVASNFIEPFKEISAAFEKETNIKVEGTFSSSGNLFTQIVNGAPYDLFLSADEERPAALLQKNLAEKPFVYAFGRVVLWGKEKSFCGAKDWRDALNNKMIKKMAFPNSQLAPYGAAAESALKKAGLWDRVEKKLIFAQDVGQAFQYAVTGGTEACFCALSATVSAPGKEGCTYEIGDAPPIMQAACLINRTKMKNDVLRFVAFLGSPAATSIKKRYGYQ